MTLKSPLQDVKETTLAAVAGLLGKLGYLASLRREGRYAHWGMETVHGPESSEEALRTAHDEVVTGILRTPLASLEQDLEESSQGAGVKAQAYLQGLRSQFEDLLPGESRNAPSAGHLNSVLVALSHLEKNREHATRSTS